MAMTRTYWFLAEWRWYELLGLAAPLAILAVRAWTQACIAKSRCGAASSSCAGADGGRGGRYCVVDCPAVCARGSGDASRGADAAAARIPDCLPGDGAGAGGEVGRAGIAAKRVALGAAMLLLGGVMLAVARARSPIRTTWSCRGTSARNRGCRRFCGSAGIRQRTRCLRWMRTTSTPESEDAQCFRAIAERSALPDYSKDGGEASIAPELTAEWTIGQAARRGIGSLETDAERMAALRPSGQ